MIAPDADALEQALAQLDRLRSTLGDVAVDAAIAALRQHAPAAAGLAAPPRLRQVSILFADVADSTAMLGRVAPDEAMQLLGEAVQGFAEAVQRWGGQVLRYTGDGIKAAFGVRGVHEDEAERAVRAGLDILEGAARHAARVRAELGIADFGVRVGIHTGDVLLGTGPEAEHSAMGHAVHLAARMEQSAPVGRLRISDTTWAQVRGVFDAEEQAPLQVKGHDEPLRTWLVHGVATGPEPRVQRGLDGVSTRMVGRETDLQALLALRTQCVRDRQAAGALVLADAGLGKTRLRDELLLALSLHEGDAGVMQARAQPSMAMRAHGLLHQLLARWFGIRDDDPGEVARQRLLDGLAPWLGDAAAQDGPRIGQLIGMDFAAHPAVQAMPAAALRRQAFDALRRVLHARAAATPLLLVLDDLHWADADSLGFVRSLLQAAPVPLMVLALARPSVLERGPVFEAEAPVQAEAGAVQTSTSPAGPAPLVLHLAPLGPAHSDTLLAALLAPLPDAPVALTSLLLQRAAGNPFFLEALVRMLVDDGVIDARQQPWVLHRERLATLRVPETLVAVLQARLDALPGDELAALQQASIVGPVFWEAALAAIDRSAPRALPLLTQRALVLRSGDSGFADTVELRFTHALLHEVTYGTVLKPQRQAGHAAVGRWLAERVSDRAGEFLALTAEHFERAGDSANALEYWDLAQIDAFRRHANEAALQATDRALAQPALTDARWRYALMINRHEMLERMGRSAEAASLVEGIAAWADECDDDAMRADLLASRMLVADHEGRSDDAARMADEAVALALRADDDSAAAALALAHGERAWLATQRHDWPSADREIALGLDAARRSARIHRRQLGYPAYQHQLRAIQLHALGQQARHADVLRSIDEALAEPDLGLRDRYNLLGPRAISQRELGQFEAAEATALEVLALTGQTGMPRLRVFGLMQCAHSALAAGRVAEAVAHVEEAQALAQGVGEGAQAPDIDELLGRLALLQGRRDDARRRWQAAIGEYERLGRTPSAWRLRCETAALDLDDANTASAFETVTAVLAESAPAAAGGRTGLPPEALLAAHAVLASLGDPRAPGLAAELRALLDEQLAALPDEAARRTLVTRVPHWAAVQALP